MGWERKRGKLLDLNNFPHQQFRRISGEGRRYRRAPARALHHHARF